MAYIPGKSTSATRKEVIDYLRARYREQSLLFPELARSVSESLYVQRNVAAVLRNIKARARATNPHRKRRGPPKGRVPPHLRKYLFKKGHR